jgi:DNA replication protein DnaC
MLVHPTLDKLMQLRLSGMHEGFQDYLQHHRELNFEDGLAGLVEREWLLRENKRITRRLRQAKLKQTACLEDIDFKATRGLPKAVILQLAQGQWIKQHLNLLITGSTGTGKSYLACALGHQACLQQFTVRYYRMPRLLQAMQIARADGSYPQLLHQLAKTQVVILDDWGIAPLTDQQRRDLLEIMDDRYQSSSTIITSQLPVDHWHENIGDATLADAILDRLLHNTVRLTLSGGSRRKPSEITCQQQEDLA